MKAQYHPTPLQFYKKVLPVSFICQTVKLCWKYELYDAVIYVYNRGMADFGTPLEVLNGPTLIGVFFN